MHLENVVELWLEALLDGGAHDVALAGDGERRVLARHHHEHLPPVDARVGRRRLVGDGDGVQNGARRLLRRVRPLERRLRELGDEHWARPVGADEAEPRHHRARLLLQQHLERHRIGLLAGGVDDEVVGAADVANPAIRNLVEHVVGVVARLGVQLINIHLASSEALARTHEHAHPPPTRVHSRAHATHRRNYVQCWYELTRPPSTPRPLGNFCSSFLLLRLMACTDHACENIWRALPVGLVKTWRLDRPNEAEQGVHVYESVGRMRVTATLPSLRM
eukprot:5213905-Pleurochrysis_carterae.AAC.3